jgi:uncharacterized protein
MESGFMFDDTSEITDLFTALVRLMVDQPEEVAVEAIRNENRMVFHCLVSPKDIGKVIGKQGRTARSLRLILLAVGAADNQKYSLDIRSRCSSVES